MMQMYQFPEKYIQSVEPNIRQQLFQEKKNVILLCNTKQAKASIYEGKK